MNPSSNESTVPASPSERVDRVQREGLAHAIRQFLSEKSSAFEFDEALGEYRESADPTVRFVAKTVWFHYDDCDDHNVTLSKPEWDYFQRLLLLLESDRQITISSTRRWSWTQLMACASLVGFAWCIWQFGWGQHLLAFSIPFGVVSIFISFVRRREQIASPYDHVLTPFCTFSDLAGAYCSATTFAKDRYPKQLANRRIRSRVAEFGVLLQTYAAWLMFSPIPLLVHRTNEDTQTLKGKDIVGGVSHPPPVRKPVCLRSLRERLPIMVTPSVAKKRENRRRDAHFIRIRMLVRHPFIASMLSRLFLVFWRHRS